MQLLLGENLRSGHNRADTSKHVYLLQSLVTCGKCAGHMEGRSGTGRLLSRHYYYVCKNKSCGFRVAEKELLRVVIGQIGQIARSPRLLGSLVGVTNQKLQAEVPALQTRKAHTGARDRRPKGPGRPAARRRGRHWVRGGGVPQGTAGRAREEALRP